MKRHIALNKLFCKVKYLSSLTNYEVITKCFELYTTKWWTKQFVVILLIQVR